MAYSEEEKKAIFHEWIQNLLTQGKRKFMLDTCDSAKISINVPDDLDPTVEAEITITVRRKVCSKNH